MSRAIVILVTRWSVRFTLVELFIYNTMLRETRNFNTTAQTKHAPSDIRYLHPRARVDIFPNNLSFGFLKGLSSAFRKRRRFTQKTLASPRLMSEQYFFPRTFNFRQLIIDAPCAYIVALITRFQKQYSQLSQNRLD